MGRDSPIWKNLCTNCETTSEQLQKTLNISYYLQSHYYQKIMRMCRNLCVKGTKPKVSTGCPWGGFFYSLDRKEQWCLVFCLRLPYQNYIETDKSMQLCGKVSTPSFNPIFVFMCVCVCVCVTAAKTESQTINNMWGITAEMLCLFFSNSMKH